MKQITRTIILLFVISSFSSVNAQTAVRNKTVVQTKEDLTTKTDSTGIHCITTIQKDSTVGDSIIYKTKTVKTKTVGFKGNSNETTETSCFSSVNGQTSVKNKIDVRSKEDLTTKTDSTGIHCITTIQKDSIVGDSIIYKTKTVKTKTVVSKGNSKETTETSSTSREIMKK
jgi:hypothetical protein